MHIMLTDNMQIKLIVGKQLGNDKQLAMLLLGLVFAQITSLDPILCRI